MSYPLKVEYLEGKGLSQLSASDLRTICNMLNGLAINMDSGTRASVTTPDQQGKGWVLNIPGLPSNANKSKWMVPTLSADNATAKDDPKLWTVDWIRAHA